AFGMYTILAEFSGNRLLLTGADSLGVLAAHSEMTLSDIAVRDSERGISFENCGVRLERARLDARLESLLVNASTATIADLVASGSVGTIDESSAIAVAYGSMLDIARVRFQNTQVSGLIVTGGRTRAADIEVRTHGLDTSQETSGLLF